MFEAELGLQESMWDGADWVGIGGGTEWKRPRLTDSRLKLRSVPRDDIPLDDLV